MTTAARPYHSPLRERQAQETRTAIIDALISLLEDGPADEATARRIAQTAGVAERTVYRHFPDRAALLAGLGDRMRELVADHVPQDDVTSVDDLPGMAAALMELLDRHHVAARAEAVFNADPRRYAADSRANSQWMQELIDAGFPGLPTRDRLTFTALIRCLVSVQAWLRMREEFGLQGDESGRAVAWAVETLMNEVRRHGFPSGTPRQRSRTSRRL